MPIGYVVNKRYVIDTKYDRYADLDVFKRLAREAGKRGFGCHVTYSAMTRGYCCEIRKYESRFRSQTSEHIYYFTEGHKYGPNPLEAACRAIRQCVPLDPLMLVLLLEAEAVQLGIEIKDRRALENQLERALTSLREVLDTIPIAFYHGDRHIGTHAVGDLRSRPSITVYVDTVNPNHLADMMGFERPDQKHMTLDDDL